MKLRMKFTKQFVVAFMGMALLLFLVLLGAMIWKERLFQSSISYKVKFSNAVGLTQNTPVYFKGFRIGKITDFSLGKDNYIYADLQVFTEYANKIVENSALNKAYNPITGTSTIEFLPGPSGSKLLKEHSLIPSILVPEGMELVNSQKVTIAGDPLSSIITNLELFSKNLLRDNNDDQGSIFRALYNVANLTDELNQLFRAINGKRDSLNLKLDSPVISLLEKGEVLAVQANNLMTRVDKMMYEVDSLLDVYKDPTDLGAKMIDPSGERIFNPLNATFEKVDQVFPQVEKLIETLDNESNNLVIVLHEFKDILRQVKQTVDVVNQNPLIGVGPTVKVKSTITEKRPKDF